MRCPYTPFQDDAPGSAPPDYVQGRLSPSPRSLSLRCPERVEGLKGRRVSKRARDSLERHFLINVLIRLWAKTLPLALAEVVPSEFSF